MIVSDQLATALVTAALPTAAVLVGVLINNRRWNDLARSVNARFGRIDGRFEETNRHIDDFKDALRAQLFHMEQVIDARLERLEERLLR